MSDVFFAVATCIVGVGVLVAFVMTAQRAERGRRSPGRHRPGAIAHRPQRLCADITQEFDLAAIQAAVRAAEAVWTCSTT